MKHLVLSLMTVFLFQSFTFILNAEIKEEPIKSSQIVWKGYKVAGSHEGTLDLKSGTLSFDNEKLVGGSFEIDMSTIACTDLDGDSKGSLEGHLKSPDFFDTAQFPNAILNFTNVEVKGKNGYTVTADLTIKGITESIVFEASIYGKKASASIKIDRTTFNVKYGSGNFFEGLKDKVIYDEFDLVIDLEF